MIHRKNKVRSSSGRGGDVDDNASSCSDTSDVVVVGCMGGGGGTGTTTTRPREGIWTKAPIAKRPESGYATWDKSTTTSNFHNIRHHQSKSAKARLWNKLQKDSIQRQALSSSTPTIVEEC